MTDAGGLVARCLARVLALPQGRRLVAVAGPPASGKSTLAAGLAKQLTLVGRQAVVVPMDGFHLDNDILRGRGLLARKGAPETFDVAGFTALIKRLQEARDISVPLFDRSLDRVVPDAATVPADCEIVVVEGNYLLFDDPHWRHLAAYWDLSIFVQPALPELRKRLVRRWLHQGLSLDAAKARAAENDLENARNIIAAQIAADLQF